MLTHPYDLHAAILLPGVETTDSLNVLVHDAETGEWRSDTVS